MQELRLGFRIESRVAFMVKNYQAVRICHLRKLIKAGAMCSIAELQMFLRTLRADEVSKYVLDHSGCGGCHIFCSNSS
jgi:hypothetical protein